MSMCASLHIACGIRAFRDTVAKLLARLFHVEGEEQCLASSMSLSDGRFRDGVFPEQSCSHTPMSLGNVRSVKTTKGTTGWIVLIMVASFVVSVCRVSTSCGACCIVPMTSIRSTQSFVRSSYSMTFSPDASPQSQQWLGCSSKHRPRTVCSLSGCCFHPATHSNSPAWRLRREGAGGLQQPLAKRRRWSAGPLCLKERSMDPAP